jgi:hypothetical protein
MPIKPRFEKKNVIAEFGTRLPHNSVIEIRAAPLIPASQDGISLRKYIDQVIRYFDKAK